ncbi:MAG: tyrosine-type recombinase/integrase [Cyclobacteriaceae bacterium]
MRAPIWVVYYANGKRKQRSTGIFVDPETGWNSDKQKVRGVNAPELNRTLEDFKLDLREEVSSKPMEEHTFLGCMEKVVALKEMEFQRGRLDVTTKNKYKKSKDHLQQFLQSIKSENILLCELVPNHIKQFEFYMAKNAKSIEYINKIIQQMRSSIQFAIDNGWINRDPFSSYRYLSAPRKIEYLYPDEFALIEELKIHNEAINKVKDMFLFSCYTGLSYIDLVNLTNDKILTNKDGDKYIFMSTRQKNSHKASKPFVIPLEDNALAILERYKNYPDKEDEGKCFPRLSNPFYNKYLKTVGELAGIKRIKLTTKVARSTAGTLLLNDGVPLETVSQILGHSNIKITQARYVELLQDKIFNDFNKVKKKQVQEEDIETKKEAN